MSSPFDAIVAEIETIKDQVMQTVPDPNNPDQQVKVFTREEVVRLFGNLVSHTRQHQRRMCDIVTERLLGFSL